MYIVQSLGLTKLKTGYKRHPKYGSTYISLKYYKYHTSQQLVTLHKHICTAIQEYLEKPKANISTFVLHE